MRDCIVLREGWGAVTVRSLQGSSLQWRGGKNQRPGMWQGTGLQAAERRCRGRGVVLVPFGEILFKTVLRLLAGWGALAQIENKEN